MLDLLTEKLSYYEMETGFKCFQAQLQTLINLHHFWINLIIGFQQIKYLKERSFCSTRQLKQTQNKASFTKI